MSLTNSSPDSNVYYQVQSVINDYFLAQAGRSIVLTTTDTAFAFTAADDGYWIIRPQALPDLCMTVDSAGTPVLADCSDDTNLLWTIDVIDGSGYVFGNQESLLFLSSTVDATDMDLTAVGTTNAGYDVDTQWGLRSVADIDDERYSTFPPGETSPTTVVPAEPTTIMVPEEPTTTDAPVVGPSPTGQAASSFSASTSGPLPALASAVILPYSPYHIENMDLTCRNCSVQGNYDIDISTDNLLDFFTDGTVSLVVSEVTSNVSLEIDLLPGFNAVDAFFTLFNLTASRNISDDTTLVLDYRFGVPLNITLDSEVNIAAGFLLNIPGELVLEIDVGNNENNRLTGIEGIELEALPFGVSAPNLAFTVATGLALRVSATIEVDVTDDIEVSGEIGLEIGFPSLNIHFAALSNVNGDCAAPGSGQTAYDPAVGITFEAAVDIETSGMISADVGAEVSWNAPTFSPASLPLQSSLLDPQCLTGDSLRAAVGSLGGDADEIGGAGSRNLPSLGALVFAAGGAAVMGALVL
ncbi:hypothetical protein EJ05DRAFT_487823 [Pseudovirgaria hyperparasitica]|uniref:Uncharacterized protein n=1 Tax=Pseudovirgaria hyperparasitica TaxID=470096 RepID=A0A6A6VZB0_9PEZI|nr:uncharacterized protein EJ05DRAFT_487823 [Pseudovirgaria hyperparasitica]KAF2756008.1 hypothetical protein EJ05DRAFT_487823 [Pseudovirgaria hyperparasitica]